MRIFEYILKLVLFILISKLAFAANTLTPQQKFSKALYDVEKYYVHPVSEHTLFENSIRGLLEGLDPHCAYLDAEDFRNLNEATQGQFAGVGLEVTMQHGIIRVITPLDDTPAEKAGLKSGDYIVKLDSTPVMGLTLRSAISKMRGPANSLLNIEVIRKGESKPFYFSLKREIIHIKSVKNRLLEPGYGYIKLAQFQEATEKEIREAVKNLKSETKLTGLILDLRNNPGGLLKSAVQVADNFIDGGKKTIIVYTKGRAPGAHQVITATPGDIISKVPMVVLINGGSASAAEILAGALKDDHRAILVGTRSFGKGSVQTVIPIGKDSAIKLTTSLYFTPSGTSIQAKGIQPNIIVKQWEWKTPRPSKKKTETNEASLQGHLAAASSKIETTSNVQDNIQDENTLMHDDYQLYQALNVLKGIVLTQGLL